MNDEFSYLGTWWIPSNPQKTWSGVVTYRPDTGVELELVAHRSDVWFEPTLSNVRYVEIMQGEVGEYPHRITLLNVSFQDHSGARTSTMFNVQLRAECLLEGNHYEKAEDISFESVEVLFSSLRDWMASVNKLLEGPWVIPVTFKKAKVNLELNAGSNNYPSLQECHIHIKPDSSQDLTWYREITDSIRDLLAFLVGRPVVRTYLSTPLHPSQVFGSRYVKIYQQRKQVEVFPRYDIDFPLERYDEHVADVFLMWFELDEDKRVPYELCLDVINNIHGYKKFEFLALVQALESYHQVITGTYDDKIDLIQRLEKLYGCLPSFLQEYLNLDNAFLISVKDTRNYYTHYNPAKREKAYKEFDLYKAITRLIPFVAAVLYRELGIPDKIILEAFERVEYQGLWQRQIPRERKMPSLSEALKCSP